MALGNADPVLSRLVAAGLITEVQAERAVVHAHRIGDRIEEAVLDLFNIEENDLLRFLGAAFRTQYVTTERLATARIDPTTVRVLPRKVLERLLVFPLVYDLKTRELTIVTPDVANADMLREVQIVSGARSLKAFLARPSSVRALIKKYFDNDLRAFGMIGAGGAAIPLDVPAGGGGATETFEVYSVSDGRTSQLDLGETSGNWPTGQTGYPTVQAAPQLPHGLGRHASTDAPAGPQFAPSAGGGYPAAYVPGVQPIGYAPHLLHGSVIQPMATPAAAAQDASAGAISSDVSAFLEALLQWIERDTGELRGHSALAQRLCRALATKLAMSAEDALAVGLGAYAHDLGKSGPHHLTPLNVLQFEPVRAQAQKVFQIPTELLGRGSLPRRANDSILNMYERFGGNGFPAGLSGEAIPLGARILAVAETYVDLVVNPKNPYRKILVPDEACHVLDGLRPVLFDPKVISACREAVLTDRIFDVAGGAARGLTGSLADMALSDVVQVLSNGRKTGLLRISTGLKSGEIAFVAGAVYNAKYGALTGEEAFYTMLTLRQGEFSLDPTVTEVKRLIEAATEALLLEGMRRLDEG